MKLPPGTDVYLVREATGQRGRLWIVKSGKKKLLKGAVAEHEIKDRPGWHYEVDAMPDYGRKKKGAAVWET